MKAIFESPKSIPMATSFNTSLKNIAANYIRLLGAQVTSSTIMKDIEENPYYPSLLCLSDTFNKYNIANYAYEIDTSDFEDLDPPFIAFANIPSVGKDFVLVLEQKNGRVNYLHNGRTIHYASKEDFLARFQKIVWVAEVHDQSGEPDYRGKRNAEKMRNSKRLISNFLFLLLLGFVVSINIPAGASVVFICLALVKLAGSAVTAILLMYDIDKNNSFIKNLCVSSERISCDAVLTSNISSIFGISWSEIGFFYFASTTLFFLIPTIGVVSKFSLLAFGSALAAPYIVFSIYYQWRVVKHWCTLCLTVQAVLALELVFSLFIFWSNRSYVASAFSNLSTGSIYYVFSLLLVCMSWYAIKKVLLKANDHSRYSSAYKRLQYNPGIFNSLLVQQPKAPDGWRQLGINIGNPNAPTTIIKVCNPYCGPCSEAHRELESLIARNSNVQLKIIFKSKNIEGNGEALVVKHLMAITAQYDISETKRALDDWYFSGEKNYLAFRSSHEVDTELDMQGKKLDAMSQWCTEADVVVTPTVFVNGYKLPDNYDIKELEKVL
jgi:uncharacterized membrane protein